jgi:hypothetical protein
LAIWRKTRYPHDYDLLVSRPDYFKELSGKGPFYTKADLTEGYFLVKFIRAQYVTFNDSTSNHSLYATTDRINSYAKVELRYNDALQGFYIRSEASHLYWTHHRSTDEIHADEPDILKATCFQVDFLGKNRFALKIRNGYFITASEGNQFKLKADAVELNPAAYIVLQRFIP